MQYEVKTCVINKSYLRFSAVPLLHLSPLFNVSLRLLSSASFIYRKSLFDWCRVYHMSNLFDYTCEIFLLHLAIFPFPQSSTK